MSVKDDLDDGLRATFTALARQQALNRQVTALGGDPATVNAALAQATPRVQELEPQKPYHDERLVIGMIVGILIYLALLSFGQAVAQGVVEEKSSRVVEILLSTIRAWQLMAGKVLGIGVVGLLQLAIVLGAGAITAAATGVLSLPASVAAGTVAWAIVWYLLGYFLFALLFAAAGALVSRQEDIGSVTMPLMMLIIVPYVIGISALPTDPENGLVRTLSLIPLFSPILMPMREAMGVATAGELAFSVVLTVALIAGAGARHRPHLRQRGDAHGRTRAPRRRLPRRVGDERPPRLRAGRSLEVAGEGFEPSKAEPRRLQRLPFDRSGIPPGATR